MLVAVFVRARVRTRFRELLWLYPLAMGFALVYSGEHYVFDVVLGWAYAVAVYRLVLRRSPSRRLEPATVPAA